METKTITLSSAGFQNINNVNSDDDFVFIIGETAIRMKISNAEFISPKISKIRLSDPTTFHYRFNYPITELRTVFTEDIIDLFQLISKGFPIEINEVQSFQMQILSVLLSNDELFLKISEAFKNSINENTLDLYLNHLRLIFKFSPQSSLYANSEIINYISSHFHSIDKAKLLSLPVDILEKIILNENLKLQNEDQLVDFIDEIETTEKTICVFYEKSDMKALSKNRLERTLNKLSAYQMTSELMKQLRSLILNPFIGSEEIKQERYTSHFCPTDPNHYNGIIMYLTGKCGGNVHAKGVVEITSSLAWSGEYSAQNLADKTPANYFCTCDENGLNAFVTYNFKNMKVHPTQYLIRTRHDGDKTHHHPKNWVIEGSNEGSNWKVISEEKNVDLFLYRGTTQIFDIKVPLKFDEKFQYLRLRQTEKNVTNDYFLCLSFLEYFGYIYENS